MGFRWVEVTSEQLGPPWKRAGQLKKGSFDVHRSNERHSPRHLSCLLRHDMPISRCHNTQLSWTFSKQVSTASCQRAHLLSSVFCFRPLLSSALVLCWKASHRIALIKLHRPASNQIIPHPPIRSPTSLTTRYAADLLYGHTVIHSNEPSQPACQPASQQTRLRLVCRGLFSLSPFFTSPL